MHLALASRRSEILDIVRGYVLGKLRKYEHTLQQAVLDSRANSASEERNPLLISKENSPQLTLAPTHFPDSVPAMSTSAWEQYLREQGKDAFEKAKMNQAKPSASMIANLYAQHGDRTRASPVSVFGCCYREMAFCRGLVLSVRLCSTAAPHLLVPSHFEQSSISHASLLHDALRAGEGLQRNAKGAHLGLQDKSPLNVAESVFDLTALVLAKSEDFSPSHVSSTYCTTGLLQHCIFFGCERLLPELLNEPLRCDPLELGAHPKPEAVGTSARWSPLQLAAYCGRGGMVRELLERITSKSIDRPLRFSPTLGDDLSSTSRSLYQEQKVSATLQNSGLTFQPIGQSSLKQLVAFYSPAKKSKASKSSAFVPTADALSTHGTAITTLMSTALSLALRSGSDLAAASLLAELFCRVQLYESGSEDFAVEPEVGSDNGRTIFPSLFCRSVATTLLDPHAMCTERIPEKNFGTLLLLLVQKGMSCTLQAVLEREIALRKGVHSTNAHEDTLEARSALFLSEAVRTQMYHAMFMETLFLEAAGRNDVSICRLLIDYWARSTVGAGQHWQETQSGEPHCNTFAPFVDIGLVIEHPSMIPTNCLRALLSRAHRHLFMIQFANTAECANELRTMQLIDAALNVPNISARDGLRKTAAFETLPGRSEVDVPDRMKSSRPILLRGKTGKMVLVHGWTAAK